MRRPLIFVLQILLLFALVSMDRVYGSDDEILAKVGNEVITRIDFETRAKSFPPAARSELNNPERRKQVLDSMIKARLVVVEGESKGLAEKEEFKARLRMIRDDLITQEYVRAYTEDKAEISDEEAQNYYDTNPEIRDREFLKVSEIVVEREEKAKQVLERLKKGEPFKKLVQEESIDPESKHRGGELEWFEKGKKEKEVEEAIAKLEKGAISDIVKGKGGYSIFKLEDKRVSPKPPLGKVRNQIVRKLQEQKMTEIAEKEIERLKKKISVEIFYDKLEK